MIGVLRPIWHAKPTQARRVLRQVRHVLLWACASGLRHDDLDDTQIAVELGPIKRTAAHRPSVPHSEVASVIAAVHRLDMWILARLMFEFHVLTAARPFEVRGARWEEIDLDGCVWTVPVERMKARTAHEAPLSPHAVALLREAHKISGTQGLVFPSRTGRQLASKALTDPLRRLGVHSVPSGFRASFRSWCSESGIAPHVASGCLSTHTWRPSWSAHCANPFGLRRSIMDRWSEYLAECTRELPAAREADGGGLAAVLRVSVDGG